MELYEVIVSSHQLYSKAVMEVQEWLDATHNTVQMWGDTDLERVSLHTNLERLKVISFLFFFEQNLIVFSKQNLQRNLIEEKVRVEEISRLAEQVLPGTIEHGQINIRSQVDTSQQEWQSLLSTIT